MKMYTLYVRLQIAQRSLNRKRELVESAKRWCMLIQFDTFDDFCNFSPFVKIQPKLTNSISFGVGSPVKSYDLIQIYVCLIFDI